MASPISPLLLVLIFSGAVGCANHATPPDSTPVYADQVAPGVAPISVERLSVNRPEAGTLTGPAASETSEPTGAPASPEASSKDQESKETDGGSAKDGPQAEGEKTTQE